MTNNKIRCLFNGEIGEHTLEEIHMNENQIKITLEKQHEAYKKYIGREVGDFICENIEYDWGTHKQVWYVRCKLCSEESKKENGYQWSRGKTGAMLCHCRKDRKKSLLREKREKREKEELLRKKEIEAEKGKIYGHFEVISCDGLHNGQCIIRCLNCGAERKKKSILQLRDGIFPRCDCDKISYNEENLIGTRNGNCVFLGMDGYNARIRCDCGRERLVRPTPFFRYKMYTDCGNPDCIYANDVARKIRERRVRGENYEVETELLLRSNGYSVKRVGKTGDFGVDLIAKKEDGTKIAVQCKCNKSSNIGVSAIQEVYAGGRYYDITCFAVVAFGNVSKAAIKMAKKLGVYISDGKTFDYPEDLKKYALDLIPTVKVPKYTERRKLYEINGEWKTMKDWACLYNTSVYNIQKGIDSGLTFETAVHYKPKDGKNQTINGVTGSIEYLCNYFGIVTAQTARYRIKRGMSVEDAILTPKTQSGRPKKNKESAQITFAV